MTWIGCDFQHQSLWIGLLKTIFEQTDIATQIVQKYPSAPILFITAYEGVVAEISNNPLFHNKRVIVLLKPLKLDKLEKSMLQLVNKN